MLLWEKEMLIREIKNLTDTEIRELSLQKNKKGNATCDAKIAQKILWERNGSGFNTGLCDCPYGSKRFASSDKMNGYK